MDLLSICTHALRQDEAVGLLESGLMANYRWAKKRKKGGGAHKYLEKRSECVVSVCRLWMEMPLSMVSH